MSRRGDSLDMTISLKYKGLWQALRQGYRMQGHGSKRFLLENSYIG